MSMGWMPPLGFDLYCKGKWLPLQDEFTPSINSTKNFLQQLKTDFEKSKNQISSKMAELILIAEIYVIEGFKGVLKKTSRTHFVHEKGLKKIVQIFK